MNVEGYQSYLEHSGKWDAFAGNEIQKLLKLEKDLQIDLDDYIPYNGDYSLVDKLNGMMSDEMRYNEPLHFAINRYMVYRLSETEE